LFSLKILSGISGKIVKIRSILKLQ
jgi:hypothetical protein